LNDIARSLVIRDAIATTQQTKVDASHHHLIINHLYWRRRMWTTGLSHWIILLYIYPNGFCSEHTTTTINTLTIDNYSLNTHITTWKNSTLVSDGSLGLQHCRPSVCFTISTDMLSTITS